MAEHECPHGRIECEAVHAAAGAIDQHGRGAIDDITSGHLPRAALQYFVARDGAVEPFGGAAQNRKRRANAHVDVDVRRAVQWIENHDILGVRRAAVGQQRLLVFLRGHHRHAFAHASACSSISLA